MRQDWEQDFYENHRLAIGDPTYQARRGLSYLRWNHGDLDEIARSLYRGRVGSRRKQKAEPARPSEPNTG